MAAIQARSVHRVPGGDPMQAVTLRTLKKITGERPRCQYCDKPLKPTTGVRRTDTRSGKTRFARHSLASEFWCVTLNRALGTVISQCRPLRTYSQPRSAPPQLQSYNTHRGIENVTTNPDFAGTSAHGIPNCCALAPWPLKMDRAQIIGGSCSKARKAAPPLPGKIDLHRHQEVLPCHCGERLG